MFDGLQEIRKSPLSAVTWLKSVLSLCTKQLAPSQITYRLQLNVLQKKKNKQETCSHALARYHYQFCRNLQFLYKRVHGQSLDTENDGRKRKHRSLTEHSLYFLWQDLNKQFKISMKQDFVKWLKKSVFLLQNLELVVIFYSKMQIR